MKFPVFKSKDELETTPWFDYLTHIYGDIPDSSFPLDLNQFDLFYTNLFNLYNIQLTDKCIQGSDCFTVCPTQTGQLYGNMSNVLDMQHTLWIYHKPPYKQIPKHTMIEVTHVTDAFPGQSKLETVGSWMYKATGSGIYFNTGNTISFQDHSEAARYFLNIEISCPIREECPSFFQSLFTKAKEKGYDSIQFLGHTDMRCGNTAIELVDLHGDGDYACGNKTKYNVYSGWKGVNPCDCDNHKVSMNCKVGPNRIGGYELYKLKPYGIKDYLNLAYYHKQTTLNYLLSFLIYVSILYFVYDILKKNPTLPQKYKMIVFVLLVIGSFHVYKRIVSRLT